MDKINDTNILSIPKEVLEENKFTLIKEDIDHIEIGLIDFNNIVDILNILEKYNLIKNREVKYSLITESSLLNKLEEINYKNFKNDSIIDIVNTIIKNAIDISATDIHIEPYDNKLVIKFRVLGDLNIFDYISKENQNEFVARIKILSKLDPTERRRPQDGRFSFQVANNKIDIRVSTLPLLYGEKIVLRILDKSSLNFKLESLKIKDKEYQLIKRFLDGEQGLIILTGPAGSGKTTTAYTLLNELNIENHNIITIEDPVEYTFNGLNQSQVNLPINYTYQAGLKSILRQDPDIIFIGEIRDREVANLSLRAAETGHLVISTVHSDDSAAAIFRLLGMGLDEQLLISGLSVIISQRLIKILCDNCKIKVKANVFDIKKLGLDLDKEYYFYEANGCEKCINGYVSREAILEILEIDSNLRDLLQDKPHIDKIREKLGEMNIKTLKDAAKELLIDGRTTLRQVYKLRR